MHHSVWPVQIFFQATQMHLPCKQAVAEFADKGND